jgi:hypothetical protein
MTICVSDRASPKSQILTKHSPSSKTFDGLKETRIKTEKRRKTTHLFISVNHVPGVHVFDRFAQLIHDVSLMHVFENVAALYDVVEIGVCIH